MDWSPPGSSGYGISQARILEWFATFSCRGIFLTQGLNTHFLHWQVDSLLRSHQGSPVLPGSLVLSFPQNNCILLGQPYHRVLLGHSHSSSSTFWGSAPSSLFPITHCRLTAFDQGVNPFLWGMSTGSEAQLEQRCRGGDKLWLQGQWDGEAAGAEGSFRGRLRDKGGKAGGELIIKDLERPPEEFDL